jgi:hypothetical protein
MHMHVHIEYLNATMNACNNAHIHESLYILAYLHAGIIESTCCYLTIMHIQWEKILLILDMSFKHDAQLAYMRDS